MLTIDQLSSAPEQPEPVDETTTFDWTASSPVVHDISTRDKIIAMTVAAAGSLAVVSGITALYAFRHRRRRRKR